MKKTTILCLAIAVTMIFAVGCGQRVNKNDGHVDLNWYMNLTYEDESKLDVVYSTKIGDTVAAVALEDGYSQDYAIVAGEDIYLNVNTLQDNVDERFYYDKVDNKIIFTTATESKIVDLNENTNQGFVEKNNCYVNINYVKQLVDLDVEIHQGSEKAPTIVQLKYSNNERKVMTVTANTEIRTKADYLNLIVTEIAEEQKVTVIKEENNWIQVITESGYIGYINKEYLEQSGTVKGHYARDDEAYTHITMDEKVCLGWNQVYSVNASDEWISKIGTQQGVNVISPTWFSIEDKDGNISSNASKEYVKKAHSMGIQVWALINDFNGSKITKPVFASERKRQALINNIMLYVNSYDIDGINVDFELISLEMVDDYLQFLRELSVECRKNQIVLSVDNYVPSDFSDYLDRKQQAKLCDYFIIMNYDEHNGASTEIGSVASIPFVKEAIEKTIEQVEDAGRVINGNPLYTRLWVETLVADGGSQGTLIEDPVNGDYYLETRALGMDAAKSEYRKAGVKPKYDKATGQNFVTYESGNSTCSIWLEDETSIKARLELMNEYNLGGAAFWALGQENSSVWSVVAPYFN